MRPSQQRCWLDVWRGGMFCLDMKQLSYSGEKEDTFAPLVFLRVLMCRIQFSSVACPKVSGRVVTCMLEKKSLLSWYGVQMLLIIYICWLSTLQKWDWCGFFLQVVLSPYILQTKANGGYFTFEQIHWKGNLRLLPPQSYLSIFVGLVDFD